MREVIGHDPSTTEDVTIDPTTLLRHAASVEHHARARRVIVRGVASAARAARRPAPLLIERAQGSTIIDADGHRYTDYVMAFGSALLGHSPTCATEAMRHQLERGVLFGSSHRGEAEIAERVVSLVPGAERVAFASSGSDAAFLATRIARSATGRPLVLKFEGHYHGWLDPLYVNVPGVAPFTGDGPLSIIHGTAGLPPPPGVIVCRWNDRGALQQVFDERGTDIALVIMEPVACNFGTYDPDPGYLAWVRQLCDRSGALLGFDEVITGFRLGSGGAQGRSGVVPDLTVLSKALGGGLPIGLVAGSVDVMAVAHEGAVRVQGTTNGSALSTAAAIAGLDVLAREGPELYARLERHSERLAAGVRSAAAQAGVPITVNRVGSVLQMLWAAPVATRSYSDVYSADPAPIADLACGLLAAGVHVLERGLMFVSTAHTEAQIDHTIEAVRSVLSAGNHNEARP